MTLPLVGRSAEVETLIGLLTSAANGDGTTVLLPGEPGIGKSRLLSVILLEAERRGFDVCHGAANELEQGRPFGPLVSAFGLRSNTVDAHAAIVAAQLELGTAEPSQAPESGVGFAVADEIVGLVEARAARAPLLVAVDDLHWADAGTLLTLQLISQRASSLSVLVVCTVRPVPSNPELDALLRALRSAGLREISLRPLGTPEVHELARIALGTEPGSQLLALLRAAAGNPLFVTELIASLQQEEIIRIEDGTAEVESGVIPPTLGLTILQRLSYLRPESVDVLQRASILGSRFTALELATVVGRSVSELLLPLRELRAAALLDESGEDLQFHHDLVRQAVYEDLPASVRRGLHHEAARALERAGAPRTRVASHYAIGAEVGDREAAEYLHAAAMTVLSADGASALRLVDRAIEISDTEDLRMRATRVHALAGAGRLAEAAESGLQLIADAPDRAEELGLVPFVARCLAIVHRWDDGADSLEQSAERDGVSDETRTALRAEALFWRSWIDPTGVQDRAEAMLRASPDRSEARYWCVAALTRIAPAQGKLRHVADLITELGAEAVAARARTGPIDEAFAQILAYLGHADRLDEVDHYLDLVEQRRRSSRSVTDWWFEAMRGSIRYFVGDWDDAVVWADLALSLAREVGARTGLGSLLASRNVIACRRDDVPTARFCTTELETDEFWRPIAVWARALLCETTGDRPTLEATLAGQVDVLVAYPIAPLVLPEAGRDLVRLYVELGDPTSARRVVEAMQVIANNNELAWTSAAAGACRGFLERDLGLLAESVDAARASPRRLLLAECLEWFGFELLRMDRHRDAASPLREALEIYDRLGAVRDVSRLESALRSAGVRSRSTARRPTQGWESLTDRELDVARLVAEGLSYRDIGERLFLSRRTVETHVAHVFTKLGIRTRAALTEAVRRSS